MWRWFAGALVFAGACGRFGYSELPRRDVYAPSDDAGPPPTGGNGHAPLGDAGDRPGSDAGNAPASDAGDAPANDAAAPGPDADVPGGDPVLPVDAQGGVDCTALPDALACASFAQGIPATMETRSYGGTVQAAAGSVEAVTDAGAAKAALVATFAPQFSGQLYVRFDMQLTSSAPLVGVNFLGVTDAVEPWPESEIDFNAIAGPRTEAFLLESGAAYTSEQPFPQGLWTCVEVLVDISEQAGAVRLSFDSQVAVEANALDTALPMGLARVSVGIDFTAQDQGPASVLVDNLVVSTQPYRGCP
jgi:hypothetical protein